MNCLSCQISPPYHKIGIGSNPKNTANEGYDEEPLS